MAHCVNKTWRHLLWWEDKYEVICAWRICWPSLSVSASCSLAMSDRKSIVDGFTTRQTYTRINKKIQFRAKQDDGSNITLCQKEIEVRTGILSIWHSVSIVFRQKKKIAP
jgi:hypothetical protein